jgi:predicted phosphoribosyltransferase
MPLPTPLRFALKVHHDAPPFKRTSGVVRVRHLFRDRHDAGQQLAQRLEAYAHRREAIVLALPRGGVPVGYEVARWLGAPLEAFVVCKLGLPGQEELAMGALASGGVRVLNPRVVSTLGKGAPRALERVTAQAAQELQRREAQYRGNRPFPKLRGRTVILVDDGLATGATMCAAVQAVRPQAPRRIVVAVPVASRPTCPAFATRSMNSSAPSRRRTFGPWACSTKISRRPPMRKWANCSHAFRAPLPPKEALRTKTTVRHLKGSAGVTGRFSLRAVAHRLGKEMTLGGPG